MSQPSSKLAHHLPYNRQFFITYLGLQGIVKCPIFEHFVPFLTSPDLECLDFVINSEIIEEVAVFPTRTSL